MSFFSRTHQFGAAALIMGLSIVLSRFMGLARDKVISWKFGAGGEADIYFAAFVIPDFINYLLAGGYISITIIPLLAKRFKEDEADAWKFFSAIFWWALLVSGLLTLLCMFAAPELASLSAPGFSAAQLERLTAFLRLILPAQIFFLAGACFSALLYYRRQFSVPALTPLIYNGFIILGGLVWPYGGMEGFCIGVTLGAAVGAFWLPWHAARAGGGVHLRPVLRHPLLKKFLIIALPLMLGQSAVMLNEQFLRIFGSMAGDGAVSLLSYARRMANVPVGMIGQAAAVASYPFLAALAAEKTEKAAQTFNGTLNTAFASSLAIIFPVSAWTIAAAQPIMEAIFLGGRFGLAEAAASAPMLQIMTIASPLWVMQMIMSRAFYAEGDTITPALCGTLVTFASLPFFFALAKGGEFFSGATATALISTAGIVVYALLIIGVWIKRKGFNAFAGLPRLCAYSLLISALAAVPAWLLAGCGANLNWPPVLSALAALAVSGLIFAIVYLALALKFQPVLAEPFMRILRRFGPLKKV